MAGESEDAGLPINGTILSFVLIFIPGIICYGIVAALAEKKKRDNVTIFLQMFIYGISSYLLLALSHHFVPCLFPGVDGIPILNPAEIGKAAVDPIIIAYATGFGVIQGVLITVNLNRQLVLKACRKIGLSARFGDEDVWTLLLNSTVTDNWVTIRHKERNLVYQGYVSGFSSGDETRELLLMDVRVFDPDTLTETGGMLMVTEIPFIYMSFVKDDVTLEFGAKPQ